MRSGKAAFRAWLRSLTKKETRRGALRRQQNRINRELDIVRSSSVNGSKQIVSGAKYSVGQEIAEGFLGPTINDYLPPLWKTYTQQ